MSEQRGEISEVDALTTDQPVGDGDTTPAAADANQVADGEPKNYAEGDARDQDLARREEHDGLRVERDTDDNVVRDDVRDAGGRRDLRADEVRVDRFDETVDDPTAGRTVNDI